VGAALAACLYIWLTISRLLSLEITFEAFERLWEGTKTKRLAELFVVSTMGLLVNLVGMMAFGHHHHGHSHDHSHSNDHSHSHDQHHEHHDHGHSHSHDHCDHHSGENHSHDHGPSPGHGHSRDNENMQGIYLHVLADTLGSASVIVSTILTGLTGWSGWDPLASCLIAFLIAMSARPLVMSSATRLLLSIPDDVEYNLRNTLAGIVQQRGVVGYSTPKFWIDDRSGTDSGDKLLGIVHVVAARGASMDDVRDRVRNYLLKHGMDIVVQVEREGDGTCWCGIGRSSITSHTGKAPLIEPEDMAGFWVATGLLGFLGFGDKASRKDATLEK
jgi:solute carrier family 30 (zinc transporter), member 5/7